MTNLADFSRCGNHSPMFWCGAATTAGGGGRGAPTSRKDRQQHGTNIHPRERNGEPPSQGHQVRPRRSRRPRRRRCPHVGRLVRQRLLRWHGQVGDVRAAGLQPWHWTYEDADTDGFQIVLPADAFDKIGPGTEDSTRSTSERRRPADLPEASGGTEQAVPSSEWSLRAGLRAPTATPYSRTTVTGRRSTASFTVTRHWTARSTRPCRARQRSDRGFVSDHVTGHPLIHTS